jgi:hypothetical protein
MDRVIPLTTIFQIYSWFYRPLWTLWGFCNVPGQFERYSRCLGRVLECPDHDVDVKGRKSDLEIRGCGTRMESTRTIVLLLLRSTCSHRFEIGQACTTQRSDIHQNGNFYHYNTSRCSEQKHPSVHHVPCLGFRYTCRRPYSYDPDFLLGIKATVVAILL